MNPIATVHSLVFLLAILCLWTSGVQAQDNPSRWAELSTAFESGARHGTAWNLGWGTVYGASIAHSLYTLGDTSDSDDRLDAKVTAVKSGLALIDTFLNPQPHGEALQRFQRLAAQGNSTALAEAERLRAGLAAEEQRRRGLNARLQPLVVNLLGGLVIAVGDDRPRDGAINFATGMLVTELSIWTQPSAVSRLGGNGNSISIRTGSGPVELQYSWLFTPRQAAVHLRF